MACYKMNFTFYNIMIKCTKIQSDDVDWIQWEQNRVQRWAAKMVMQIQVLLTTWPIAGFLTHGCYTMELFSYMDQKSGLRNHFSFH